MLLLGSVSFIEGVSGSWYSPALVGVAPFTVQALSSLPPSITAVMSGSSLRLLDTASPGDGIVGDWPMAFQITDSVAVVQVVRVNVVFLPASEAFAGKVDSVSSDLAAFYYVLCGGPLCKEYINGQ